MRYRLLGQTGLRVSELFLGAMIFGGQGAGRATADECRRMFELCADAGVKTPVGETMAADEASSFTTGRR